MKIIIADRWYIDLDEVAYIRFEHTSVTETWHIALKGGAEVALNFDTPQLIETGTAIMGLLEKTAVTL